MSVIGLILGSTSPEKEWLALNDIPETGEEWFKNAKLRLAPRTAQDQYGWLVAPIGISLVLGLLAWAAQTPTRFVPPLKRQELRFTLEDWRSTGGMIGAPFWVCTASTTSAIVTTSTSATTFATVPGPLMTGVFCQRTTIPIPIPGENR